MYLIEVKVKSSQTDSVETKRRKRRYLLPDGELKLVCIRFLFSILASCTSSTMVKRLCKSELVVCIIKTHLSEKELPIIFNAFGTYR